MKKPYQKPQIAVEYLQLDQPIAIGCEADRDDMNDLLGFGYFTAEINCGINQDAIEWGNDTICYHSNVTTAFLS